MDTPTKVEFASLALSAINNPREMLANQRQRRQTRWDASCDQDEMIELIFKNASASEADDYYQVSFDDDDDTEAINGRYLLIQRQFELADDDSY